MYSCRDADGNYSEADRHLSSEKRKAPPARLDAHRDTRMNDRSRLVNPHKRATQTAASRIHLQLERGRNPFLARARTRTRTTTEITMMPRSALAEKKRRVEASRHGCRDLRSCILPALRPALKHEIRSFSVRRNARSTLTFRDDRRRRLLRDPDRRTLVESCFRHRTSSELHSPFASANMSDATRAQFLHTPMIIAHRSN